MNQFISWCNANNGFLTAILSAIGLLLSSIAIIVSINTARLPYKKRIKLSLSTSVAFEKDTITGEVTSKIIGLSVNVANTGYRNVNITYLGLSIKDKSLPVKKQKMTKIKDTITGIGMLAPYEIKTELYRKDDLLYSLSMISKKAKIYLFAEDTEGKAYYKRIGNAENMIKNLSIE